MKMKIFGWMQNKINARFHCNNTNSISVNHDHHHNAKKQEIHPNEEFSDWPHGLLAIGTFGNTNKDVKQEEKEDNSKPESNQENQEFTVPDAENIKTELDSSIAEDDCRNNNVESGLVVGGPKTLNHADNANNNINKKSFSFLLKKMFVCRGGFNPALNLKDQLPESTMEKMLRAMLHKKIYPQNQSSSNSSTKRVLPNKRKPTCDEESKGEDDKGSKWVKTDSEYIVLEI